MKWQVALHFAVIQQDFDGVQCLIKNGAGTNFHGSGDFFYDTLDLYFGATPLSEQQLAACLSEQQLAACLSEQQLCSVSLGAIALQRVSRVSGRV